MKPLRPIRVDWEDSASMARWIQPEELSGFGRCAFIVSSVGFLVYEDKKAIVLAGQQNAEGWFGNPQRIPKLMIRKRT